MFEFDENSLIASCALRFDGPSYLQDHPHFKHKKALEKHFQTGSWPEPLAEKMALFYLLQLSSAEPKNGIHWHAYRELFLQLYSQEPPQGYKREDYWQSWRQKYSQVLPHAVKFVREIHKGTEYESIPPKPGAVLAPPAAEEDPDKQRPSWLGRLFRGA